MQMPNLAALAVGLSSRNEPTLGGEPLLDAAVSADVAVEASAGRAVVEWRMRDCFGLPAAGVRIATVAALGPALDVFAAGPFDVLALDGALSPAGAGLWAGLSTSAGVLRLSWGGPMGCRLALRLSNGRLVATGALAA